MWGVTEVTVAILFLLVTITVLATAVIRLGIQEYFVQKRKFLLDSLGAGASPAWGLKKGEVNELER